MKAGSVLTLLFVLVAPPSFAQSAEEMADHIGRVIRFEMQWGIPFRDSMGHVPLTEMQAIIRELDRASFHKPLSGSEGEYSAITENRKGALGILPLFPEDKEKGPPWKGFTEERLFIRYQSNDNAGVLALYTSEPISPFWRSVVFLLGAHSALVQSGILQKKNSRADHPKTQAEVDTAGYILLHQVFFSLRGGRYTGLLNRHIARIEKFKGKRPPGTTLMATINEVVDLFGQPASSFELDIWENTLVVLTVFHSLDQDLGQRPEIVQRKKEEFMTQLRKNLGYAD